jgi:hypothetical protein
VKAFAMLAVGAVSVLLARVLPDAWLNTRYAFREEPGLFMPAGLVTLATLALVMGIERWAQRITGHRVPFERRLLIPIPSVLLLVVIFKVVMSPIGTGQPELMEAPLLLALAILPFVLLEDTRAPMRFILGVWSLHGIWFLLVVWMQVLAGAGQWRDAIIGSR